MAYEIQNWECGDVVTAEKLNHMEQGIESANSGGGTVEVVKIASVMDAQTQAITVDACSSTYAEITEMIRAGKVVIASVSLDVQYEGASVQKHILSIPLQEYSYDGSDANVRGYLFETDKSLKTLSTTLLVYRDSDTVPLIHTWSNRFAS